jgi:hypothetical protein
MIIIIVKVQDRRFKNQQMGAINSTLHVEQIIQHLKIFHHFLHFRSLWLKDQLFESKICCNNKFMENQIYNGFPNHKQLATYQKIAAMSKLVDNTINKNFNKYGFVVFCILLHENHIHYVNNFEKGGF